MTTLTCQLARFIGGLSYAQLPPEVTSKAKTFILHGIGAGLAGYSSNTVKEAIRLVKKLGVFTKGATLLVDGDKVPLTEAAFANAILLHSRAQEDDFHRGMMHIGVVTIPAALALAEMAKKSGRDLIVGIVAGYEVAARLTKDHARFSIARGFRTTPLYGPLAAAAAASRILNLNERQTIHALGLAANCGAGLLQCGVAHTLNELAIQGGFASCNGLRCALLGQMGAVACDSILEGERGFYQAFTGTGEGLGRIVEDLGRKWEMMDTFFKRYPVGGLNQTPVHVALSLVKEKNLMADEIQHITVNLNPKDALYPGANSLKPGALSVQFCVATAIVNGAVTFDSVWQNDNPKVLDLMPRITVEADEGLEPLSCDLSVLLKDGGVLRQVMRVDPLSYCLSLKEDAELIASIIPEMAVPEKKARKAIDIMIELEKLDNLSALIENLVA